MQHFKNSKLTQKIHDEESIKNLKTDQNECQKSTMNKNQNFT